MAGETLVESYAGEFTGKYAMEITTCRDAEIKIPTDKRVLNWRHSHTDGSFVVLREWAAARIADHLKAHKGLGTPPCQPLTSPVFRVYESIHFPTGVVLLPLSE